MLKYKKKPVIVEAHQMTADQFEDWGNWPKWLEKAWNKHLNEPGVFFKAEDGTYWIHTLEGNHRVSKNDFIIKGVKGELYPCKADIFHMTYSEV